MIDALIYDLDGTLINSAQDLTESMNHARTSLGYPEKEATILSTFIGDGLDTFISRAFETDDSAIIEKAKPVFKEYYASHTVHHTTLYEGVKETLAHLDAAGIKQFIFSNKPVNFIKPILDHFGITGHFKELIGQYMFKSIKPDPEAIHFLIEKYDLDPSRTLMVGDNYTDVEAGHNAGIQTVFCSFGMGKPSKTVKTDYSIDRFEELMEIVQNDLRTMNYKP